MCQYIVWAASGLIFLLVLFKLKSIEITIDPETNPTKVMNAYKAYRRLTRRTTAFFVCLWLTTIMIFAVALGKITKFDDSFYYVLAGLTCFFAAFSILIFLSQAFHFTKMAFNYLKILSGEMNLNLALLKFCIYGLVAFSLIDQLRLSGFLSNLIINFIKAFN